MRKVCMHQQHCFLLMMVGLKTYMGVSHDMLFVLMVQIFGDINL